jgi:hypothetical protein
LDVKWADEGAASLAASTATSTAVYWVHCVAGRMFG